MNFYFTYESRDTLKTFTLFVNFKAITILNLGRRNKSEIEFQKISRRRIGHFTLLFCRGWQRNLQSYNTRAQPLFCLLNLLFSDVAVAVVVFLTLPAVLQTTAKKCTVIYNARAVVVVLC